VTIDNLSSDRVEVDTIVFACEWTPIYLRFCHKLCSVLASAVEGSPKNAHRCDAGAVLTWFVSLQPAAKRNVKIFKGGNGKFLFGATAQ